MSENIRWRLKRAREAGMQQPLDRLRPFFDALWARAEEVTLTLDAAEIAVIQEALNAYNPEGAETTQ